jgi:GPI mannosyltransferase 3
MSRTGRSPTPELAALLAFAFLLRLGTYWLLPNIHWPDEIFQAMEPAHRLVYGTGAVSWEWTVGIRSWLFPGIIAGLMEIGRLGSELPAIVNLPVAIVMTTAGCAPVACAYGWGRTLTGRAGGFAAASLGAVWADLVYMSSHTLTEIAAADALVVALYLGFPLVALGEQKSRRLIAAGAMLGVTFALRFHLAPALLVAAIGMCGIRHSGARWRDLILGAAVPIVAMGALDWVTLGAPFQSIWLNVWFNLGKGISDEAGDLPFMTLFVLPFYLWGGGFAAVILAAAIGARRLPWVAAVAVTIFLTHAVIPHKEYRFIYPALMLVVVLAGIGTAELLQMLREARPAAFSSARSPAMLAAIFWTAISLAIALSPVYHLPWTRERAQLLAFDYVAQQDGICGVGLYGIRWTKTPGDSWLPLAARLHQTDAPHLSRDATVFNAIVARERAPVPDERYRRVACFGGDQGSDGRDLQRLCVWRREGGCALDGAPLPVNWPRALRQGPDVADPAPGWEDPSNDR